MRPVVLPRAAAGGSTGRLDLPAAGGCAAGSGKGSSRPGVGDPSGSPVGLAPGVGVTLHLVLLVSSVIATQNLPSCSALDRGTPRLCARMCVRACVRAVRACVRAYVCARARARVCVSEPCCALGRACCLAIQVRIVREAVPAVRTQLLYHDEAVPRLPFV